MTAGHTHTHLELCPDCQGLVATELTSVGVHEIAIDSPSGFITGPGEIFIGPTPQPCDTKKISQPISLAGEIAIEWGLADPATPPPPTPIDRALDILRPHLAWDHRYRETP
ncbi:hypothetical protein [Streptomyces sp. 1222.5]|uniref:hypothetical protein n=1 Tax=Streptomyces sp. 1222.5 TaxID=1881026 RepID=UPI003D756864